MNYKKIGGFLIHLVAYSWFSWVVLQGVLFFYSKPNLIFPAIILLVKYIVFCFVGIVLFMAFLVGLVALSKVLDDRINKKGRKKDLTQYFKSKDKRD